MFELFAAYRNVLHIAEWTGLSAGALAACAAAAYFGFAIPAVRRAAIAGAVAVGAGYLGLMHGVRRHPRRRREAMGGREGEDGSCRYVRDADATTDTAKTFDPVVVVLQQQEAARQQKVTNVSSAPAPMVAASALLLCGCGSLSSCAK